MSTWKSIAVFIDHADPDYGVINYAGWLAQQCDAHLIGIFNLGAVSVGPMDFPYVRGDAAIQETLERRRELEQAAA